ncbi:MAG: DUF488 family protein [Candidatus Dojkabacteria bacterium]|nr:DUF488 family protein [Candidatus Dojkabacteria bacterium]
MLKETYISNIKNLPKGVLIMKVTRTEGHPLSPSWNLLNKYKRKEITWDEFIVEFKNEMESCSFCQIMMKNVKELAKSRDVYLCCYEKQYPCHRFLLMDMINKME